MNFDSGIPIYVQIAELIKTRIVTGMLSSGEKLPSVREMATELKVNPNTVQRSYSHLEREEIVYTQRGMGTFVTEDTQILGSLKDSMAREKIVSFIEEMKNLGYSSVDIPELIRSIPMEGE